MQSHHKVVVNPGDAVLSTVSGSTGDKWKCEVRTLQNSYTVKCMLL